jgi:hypothetical protein
MLMQNNQFMLKNWNINLMIWMIEKGFIRIKILFFNIIIEIELKSKKISKKKKKSIFYFKVGGGFMHMPINEKQNDLADSWLYGLICADAGLRFQFKKMEVDVGYGFEHISSPFHSGSEDPGVNTGGLVITLKF